MTWTRRRQLKKKWVLAALIVPMAALIPAEASSPSLSHPAPSSRISSTCGQKAINLDTVGTDQGSDWVITWGSCAAGSTNCCYGYPEAVCVKSNGYEPM